MIRWTRLSFYFSTLPVIYHYSLVLLSTTTTSMTMLSSPTRRVGRCGVLTAALPDSNLSEATGEERKVRVVSMGVDEARRRTDRLRSRPPSVAVVGEEGAGWDCYSFVTLDLYMASVVAAEGRWMFLEEGGEELSFLAHVVRNQPKPKQKPKPNENENENESKNREGGRSSSSSWKLRFWRVGTTEDTVGLSILTHGVLESVVRESSSPVAASTLLVLVGISALDRDLVPAVARAFDGYSPPSSSSFRSVRCQKTYDTPCNLWVLSSSSSSTDTLPTHHHHETKDDERPTVRNLTPRDAPLVNERWEYKSSTSLATVTRTISSPDNHGRCLGAEIDGVLVAWVLRYLDGPLGMLWCEEGFRRRGLARVLVGAAAAAERGAEVDRGGGGTVVAHAYIVDGNRASEGLFGSMGWERVRSVDWVGFSLRGS